MANKFKFSPIYQILNLIWGGIKLLGYIYIYRLFFYKKYQYLKKLKNIHVGETAFIVATGPSLTIEDVNKLKGKKCFAMNSIYKLFDKTDWRPTYYCIVDRVVYRNLHIEIENAHLPNVFFNDLAIDYAGENACPLPMWINFCRNEFQRKLIPSRLRKVKFSSDISKYVYEGTTVVHTLMQLIFYMGFKKIYLIGTDCNYSGSSKHSTIANYKSGDKLENSPEDLYKGMMADYECAKTEAEKRGIEIFNATRGGMLELFPRVDLDSIL